MLYAVREYGNWLRQNYADFERKEVWQSVLILALFLLFFIVYSITTGRSRVVAYIFQFYNMVLVAILVWRVETLRELSETTSPEAELSEGPDAEKSSSTPQAIPASIGPLLKQKCEDAQLYLEHDLSLAQLSQAIGTNRYYLSQYFAQQGLTYNTYINNLRIRHFTSLYHKAVEEGRSFTAKQLAFESGYYSYSTFSAVFKQHTGKTVTAWMKGIPQCQQ
jgi:AraC-like DNA-binding protein